MIHIRWEDEHCYYSVFCCCNHRNAVLTYSLLLILFYYILYAMICFFIYWNNVVLSLCFGTDLHALELIFLIEWIVDATHMSVITFVQFCFCYLDLKLYDSLSLVFWIQS